MRASFEAAGFAVAAVWYALVRNDRRRCVSRLSRGTRRDSDVERGADGAPGRALPPGSRGAVRRPASRGWRFSMRRGRWRGTPAPPPSARTSATSSTRRDESLAGDLPRQVVTLDENLLVLRPGRRPRCSAALARVPSLRRRRLPERSAGRLVVLGRRLPRHAAERRQPRRLRRRRRPVLGRLERFGAPAEGICRPSSGRSRSPVRRSSAEPSTTRRAQAPNSAVTAAFYTPAQWPTRSMSPRSSRG